MTTLAELGGWPAVLGPLVAGRDLSAEATSAAMAEILDGAATPAQLAGFVVALRMKGETVDELTGLLDAMLAAAVLVPVDEPPRTAGSSTSSAPAATAATRSTCPPSPAFVVAGGGRAGVQARQPGRLVGVRCGRPARGARRRARARPRGHRPLPRDGRHRRSASRPGSTRRCATPARRDAELGVPTVFNILGPMANPARVRRQVVGVADAVLAERMLGVLRASGAARVLVVHGDDGLDELDHDDDVDGVGARRRRPSARGRSIPPSSGWRRAEPDELVGGDAGRPTPPYARARARRRARARTATSSC